MNLQHLSGTIHFASVIVVLITPNHINDKTQHLQSIYTIKRIFTILDTYNVLHISNIIFN